jgi:hypothetical protein
MKTTLKLAIPVIGALALLAALPEKAHARDRFDFSVGFGYSNYGGGYRHGGYYNSGIGFRYSSGGGYYGGYRGGYYSRPYYRPSYSYAPRVIYRDTYYYRPAPRVYVDSYYDDCDSGYTSYSYRPVYRSYSYCRPVYRPLRSYSYYYGRYCD